MHPYSQTGFPYQGCRADSCLDGVLLQQLKESVCHMDATQCGIHDYQFSVMSKTPGELLDYEIKLSDEALLAPMGVFFPSSFCLPDNRRLMAGEHARARLLLLIVPQLSPTSLNEPFAPAHSQTKPPGEWGEVVASLGTR